MKLWKCSSARSLPSVLLSTCSLTLTLSRLKSLCSDGAYWTLVVSFDWSNIQSMNRSDKETQHLMPVISTFKKYLNVRLIWHFVARVMNSRQGDTNRFDKNVKTKCNYSIQVPNSLMTRKQHGGLEKCDEYKWIKLVMNWSILRYVSHTTCSCHLKKNKQSL